MNTTKLLLLGVALFLGFQSFAQDRIIKKDQSEILCTVIEIGLDEIKYKSRDQTDQIVYSIDKDQILKIVFENGRVQVIDNDMKNPVYYADQKKWMIKTGILGPLTSQMNFSLEKSIRPGRSLEATLGIIGLGFSNDWNAGGAYLKAGYKFIATPNYSMRGMRYSHLLKGFYIRPEVAFSAFSRDDSYSTNRDDIVGGAVLLNLGKQWVFDDAMGLDLFFGVGYGFDNWSITVDYPYYGDEPVYHYGWFNGTQEVPIAFTAGLRIGFLMK
jgi:hypothetical protein